MSRINSPWTGDEVKNLKKRQNVKTLHPYTCGDCGEILEVTSSGLMCSTDGCYYMQTWAHENDLQGEF